MMFPTSTDDSLGEGVVAVSDFNARSVGAEPRGDIGGPIAEMRVSL
jgi:hypothetical protein